MPVKTFIFSFPGTNAKCAFQYTSLDNSLDLSGNISLKFPDRREEAIRAREELLAASPGMKTWSECEQVHGSTILIDPDPTPIDGGALSEADGMTTNRPGHGLLVKTADCQPVMFAAADGSAVMALHVGWRGNRANFIGEAVRIFREKYGASPKDLMAVRGPSLGPSAAEFVNFEEEWGSEFRRFYNPANKTMNLWRLTSWQLREAGLRPENIYGLDICTYLNDRAFFSWRRARTRGRQGNLIWIEK